MSVGANVLTGALRPEPREASLPRNRMAIAVLALVGAFISSYLLLHKLGLIGALACGTGSCETVQASPWAVFLGVPVPAWGIVGYGALFGTALVGLQPSHIESRRVAWALLGLAVAAFAFSLYLTALEAFVIHAWCRWCIVSALLTSSIFALSLAELPRVRRA
ncbi:MAG: vitamin K epoxide reductase family protein [Gemmatimonadetes bacterium]|nr:vitamin K epoxide reductase family protein [Gemmatimonadota bacterium]